MKYKLNCGILSQKLKKIEKTLEIALKLPKSPYFSHFLEKKSFLNQTFVLIKYVFLNQTTYVLKNQLYQQSSLNRDSFLNWAFFNRDSTVPIKLNCFSYIPSNHLSGLDKSNNCTKGRKEALEVTTTTKVALLFLRVAQLSINRSPKSFNDGPVVHV